MSAVGYLLYLGVVFLPGIGLGELLRLWREGQSLVERFAMAFGLGLCIDTVALVAKTSGYKVAGIVLAGIGAGTLYAVMAVGLIALALGVLRNKRFGFPVKPQKVELAVFLIVLVQGIIILAHFAKYPIFPEYQSQDYAAHVQLVQGLISGSLTSIPSGVLYYGVHMQLASALVFVGGEPLVTVRWAMAILVLLSTPLFFLAGAKIFSSRLAAVIVTAIYAISATIWFGSVFNAGLYANFFGILVSLFLVVAVLNAQAEVRSVSAWVALALAVFTAYFSHYTTLTLLPAILLLPFLQLLVKPRPRWTQFLPPIIVCLPGALVALAEPALVTNVLHLVEESIGVVAGGTLLSSLLAPLPVLSYMAVETTYDIGFVVMLAFVAICVWKSVATRSARLLLLLVWFATLMVASPLSVQAWRFSYEALVPFTLMAAYGFWVILPKTNATRATRRRRTFRGSGTQTTYFALAVILVLLVAGSWGEQVVADAAVDTSYLSQAQNSDNKAIYWLGQNTPANSTYLSVSDWRFTYTGLLIGRQTFYQFASTQDQAVSIARSAHTSYIIVTYIVTVSLPPDPALYPWNNFPATSNANLTMVYGDSFVRVYRVV